MSDVDSEDSEIKQAWNIGCAALIPEKSKNRYESTYNIFKKWREEKDGNINEKLLLAYFVQRSEKLEAPGSLWAEYSMLKTTIFLHDKIDISKFATLIAFLKRKNIGYRPKRSKYFSMEAMCRFLSEAPDDRFLIQKVALIVGVAGACKREELYNININDIEDHGSLIIIKIPNSKTNIERTFTITEKEDGKIQYLEIFRKYIRLRPENAKSQRLFLNYRNGKCTNQVVGRNTIGSWPLKIAEYLNLPNATCYTGRSFQRSSAILLANKGVDVLEFKHEAWKSSTVPEVHAENPSQNKIEFDSKMLYDSIGNKVCSEISSANSSIFSLDLSNTENPILSEKCVNSNTPISFINCNNCTFNFNLTK